MIREYKQTMAYLEQQGLDKEFGSGNLLTVVKQLNECRQETAQKLLMLTGNRLIGPNAHFEIFNIKHGLFYIDGTICKYISIDEDKRRCRLMADRMPCEKSLFDLKNFVRQDSMASNGKEKWTIVLQSNCESSLKESTIIENIKNFMDKNNIEGCDNPLIQMETKKDRIKKPETNMKQNDVLVKYTLPSDYQVLSLRGQNGIKANINIPKGTVLGQYLGVELTEKQFNYIYGATRKENQAKAYAFEAHFNMIKFKKTKKKNNYNKNNYKKYKKYENNDNVAESAESKEENNKSIRMSMKHYLDDFEAPPNKKRRLLTFVDNVDGTDKSVDDQDESNDILQDDVYSFEDRIEDYVDFSKRCLKINTIILDNYPIKKSGIANNLLAFINDCRLDITNSKKTATDRKTQNIDFVCVSVNNWPCIFAIACKTIKKYDQLLADYGNKYSNVISEMKEYNSSLKDTYKEIKTELQYVGMEIQETESEILAILSE